MAPTITSCKAFLNLCISFGDYIIFYMEWRKTGLWFLQKYATEEDQASREKGYRVCHGWKVFSSISVSVFCWGRRACLPGENVMAFQYWVVLGPYDKLCHEERNNYKYTYRSLSPVFRISVLYYSGIAKVFLPHPSFLWGLLMNPVLWAVNLSL